MNTDQMKSLLRAMSGHLVDQDFDDLDAPEIKSHLAACPDCAAKAAAYQQTMREYADPVRLAAFDHRMKEAFARQRANLETSAAVVAAVDDQSIPALANLEEQLAQFFTSLQRGLQRRLARVAEAQAKGIAYASTKNDTVNMIPCESDDHQLTGMLELRADGSAELTAFAQNPDLEGGEYELEINRSRFPTLTLTRDKYGRLRGSAMIPQAQLPDGSGPIHVRLKRKTQ